jgi:hypothetical protein
MHGRDILFQCLPCRFRFLPGGARLIKLSNPLTKKKATLGSGRVT